MERERAVDEFLIPERETGICVLLKQCYYAEKTGTFQTNFASYGSNCPPPTNKITVLLVKSRRLNSTNIAVLSII